MFKWRHGDAWKRERRGTRAPEFPSRRIFTYFCMRDFCESRYLEVLVESLVLGGWTADDTVRAAWSGDVMSLAGRRECCLVSVLKLCVAVVFDEAVASHDEVENSKPWGCERVDESFARLVGSLEVST